MCKGTGVITRRSGWGGERRLWVGEELGKEEGFYVEPVVYAAEAGDVDVGWAGVEDAFAVLVVLEEAELAGVVVDKIVGAEDGLITAEDDVGCGDEGEVLGEPFGTWR